MRTTDPSSFRASNVDQLPIGVPNNRPIKFKTQFPMQLADHVPKSGRRAQEKLCLPEMMQLFTCLGKKDFDTNGCPKEVAVLNSCWTKYIADCREKKKNAAKSIPEVGTSFRELTTPQVNNLLKRYPLAHLMRKIRK